MRVTLHTACIAILGIAAACSLLAAPPDPAAATDPPTLPPGTWARDRVASILDATLRIRLAPDLSGLAPGERETLAALLEVGEIMQRLYEESRHDGAREALHALHAARGEGRDTSDLIDLYRIFQGPIATTLDNQRVAFLPVDPESPGKNVYPPGSTREALTIRDDLLDVRSVVRRATPETISRDRATLSRHPVLAALHPGFATRLDTIPEGALYAVPYAIAWGDDLVRCHDLLLRAADASGATDPDFAAYLRLRARDLITNDYEAGDAAWVAGRFGTLNAQIGAYETYDDELLGVKGFFGASVLIRDAAATARLAGALGDLQAIEDALPYDTPKRVHATIPVGVYDVVADFGQARGTNTASILPNDPDHVRKYGRTILMRGNILRHPDLFGISRATFAAAVPDDQAGDLTPVGEFERTLWHEIGHYLGPTRTRDGRPFDQALSPRADLIEEMKADLVSLFAATLLHRAGYHDEQALRAVRASGVKRVLQNVRPRRSQPYQTMQVMQMNWFLAQGLLVPEGETLRIRYDRYHEVVAGLLAEVLALQQEGDAARAEAFIERWSRWEETPHEALAARIRHAARWRYRLVTYAALGE